MTATSFGHAARPTGHARAPIARAINAGPFSTGRYLIGLAEMRDQFDDMVAGSVASRPREFAGGFVDFLLGRGARPPR